METLKFEYRGGRPCNPAQASALAGVVGSGNLEILVEQEPLNGACAVEVVTAAVGFGAIWQAVLDDFFARHPLADVRISINDVGATPAVVSLRLDQAVNAFLGGTA
ncbi:malonate decarboxylase acyl carrier protein [Insolitispirillum peregrinum]|uniref:Malonate decarboxylase acyl carrier protein n=1 Tax=Insolitispirillum peregrinum TaxID=80876 RepID=A0A1N7P795_9PROT|nr:malonate decarboxylase acyl carrier protein [Insolitispirillum peregrinum]SIT06454.1 malonate decarboxylase delta subunit [Insolitispirillum peregrinum]